MNLTRQVTRQVTRQAALLTAFGALCAWSWGCAEGQAKQGPSSAASPSPQASKDAQAPAQERFDGLIVPTHATLLRAPQNTFRISGWSSNNSWIKLVNLVEDGAQVKQGQVVAWFEFQGRDALPRVQDNLRQSEAARERARHGVDFDLDQLASQVQQLQIAARRAELDTRREGVVSGRDLDRLRLDHALATFEAQAQAQRLSALRRATRAEADYLERRVQMSQADLERFDVYKRRFTVQAPHDGVVRYSFMRRQRRKVQKGDGMGSGTEFMTVARDASLHLIFYVPEHRYALTQQQRRFLVQSPSSSKTYEVEVTRVEPFPQELGYLKGDDNLPTAREKMYVIHARFMAPPEELGAGQEVKVRLP